MVRKESSENFQPRMVASFSKPQLLSVFMWTHKNVTQTDLGFTQDFLRDVETAEFDEKGKKMDERAKSRLKYGEKVIRDLLEHGRHLDQVQGIIQVWQLTPDEDKVQIRWGSIKNSSNFEHRRY